MEECEMKGSAVLLGVTRRLTTLVSSSCQPITIWSLPLPQHLSISNGSIQVDASFMQTLWNVHPTCSGSNKVEGKAPLWPHLATTGTWSYLHPGGARGELVENVFFIEHLFNRISRIVFIKRIYR